MNDEIQKLKDETGKKVFKDILLAKLADDIREAEKALRDIEQNRFILIGKLQALRAVEAMLK